MVSRIFDTIPDAKYIANPSSILSSKIQRAIRYLEAVLKPDEKGGVPEYTKEVKWMYYDKTDDEYHLNMSDNRLDWENIFNLTVKKNEYVYSNATFYTVAKFLLEFGSFIALVGKTQNFLTKQRIEDCS